MQQLLLLHGAIGSAQQFDLLIPLLKQQVEVFRLDFSGHSFNSPLPNEFSVELFAKDVINWLDEKKISSINIVGYSMGGYVALYLAKHFPERVKNLVTLAAKFDWNSEVAAKEVAMLNPDKIAEKVPAIAKMLEHSFGSNNWKEVVTKTAEMMISLGHTPALTLTDLNSIKHSVLVSVGDKDTMVSLHETIAVYKNLNDAQLMVFPNTPHPLEKLDIKLFADVVLKFIK